MHFSVCGGCKWQNLSYEKQLQFKEDEVLNNIRRIGGIEGFEALPILGSAEQYFTEIKWSSLFLMHVGLHWKK